MPGDLRIGQIPQGRDADDLAAETLDQLIETGHRLTGADDIVDEQNSFATHQILDLRRQGRAVLARRGVGDLCLGIEKAADQEG
jgi:hypothetical protein